MQKFFSKLYAVLEEATSNCSSRYISLSGGLDSSIISYFLKNKKISAIAIITKEFIATDLTYCQLIANKFGFPLDLRNISTEELLAAVKETIKILKNFNSIEIRNSVVMYLALKSIKEKGGEGIITGDGADELFAGYNFFLKKNAGDLQNELERIWDVMHFPTRKIGEELGITVESPFLNENVIEFAKSVPANLKVRNEGDKKYGKWLLRKVFEDKLPKSIVWRDKSPLQDGAGTTALSHLFDILISNEAFKTRVKKIKNSERVVIQSKESLHYYDLYRNYYEPPFKLHSALKKCPYCQYEVKPNIKFCRMCGSFPL